MASDPKAASLLKFQKWTVIVIVLTVVLLIGWDIFVAVEAGQKATISYIIEIAAHRWPIIAGAFFLLGGHLFWRINV